MRYKKPIIFFSNPFGFGPSGGILAIIDQLIEMKPDLHIIYAASKKCLEPLSLNLKTRINVVEIDERDEKQIKNLLKRYGNPLVVVYLNRKAVKTSKAMNIQTLFIDPLTWMWRTIPQDYLKADTYYAYNIFESKKKINKLNNGKLIPPTLGNLPYPNHTKNRHLTLLHVGGFTNPLVPKLNINYLKIITKAIREFDNLAKNHTLIISGGSEAMSVFKKELITTRNNIVPTTMSRPQFLQTLNQSHCFITTPGLTATLESFSLKTPVSFLPPTNLSQWKQAQLLKNIVPLNSSWNSVHKTVSLSTLDRLDEKQAILYINRLTTYIYINTKFRKKIVKNILKILMYPQCQRFVPRQSSFINKIGTNGAYYIAKDIISHYLSNSTF